MHALGSNTASPGISKTAKLVTARAMLVRVSPTHLEPDELTIEIKSTSALGPNMDFFLES